MVLPETGGGMLTVRIAREEDAQVIYDLIYELAEYEKLTDQVTATPEILRASLFERNEAEVLLGEYGNKTVGYALFFHSFSTFKGRATMYLEDLYVKPEYRSMGFGKALLRQVAAAAVSRGCERLDWACLEWNAPSRAFYESLGAQCMADWLIYRLEGNALKGFSE